MRFAIYIRRGEETFDAIGEVPDQLRKRTLAVRGFDASGMMTGWEIVEGTNVEAAIKRQFAKCTFLIWSGHVSTTIMSHSHDISCGRVRHR